MKALLMHGLRAIARIFMLTTAVSLVFGVSVVAFALLIASLNGRPSTWSGHVLGGLACSLITCLFLAVFHFRRESIKLPIRERAKLFAKLHDVLSEMGYEPRGTENPFVHRYTPQFQSFLFGGSVSIDESDETVKLTGPKVCLELVRSRVRFKSQLSAVHKSIRQAPLRRKERILKRVQVTVRANPEQLDDIRAHVVEVLADKGEVLCEINILVNADEGLPERIVDSEIADWLSKQGIAARIYKDRIQRLDPATDQLVGSSS